MKGIFSNVKKRVGRENEIGQASYDLTQQSSGEQIGTKATNNVGENGDKHNDTCGSTMWSQSIHSPRTDPRIRDIPKLKDTPSAKKDAVFQQKLQLCCVMFDHTDPHADRLSMDLKLQTLIELKDFVNTPSGQKIFKEENIPSIMNMVQINICRALPPVKAWIDPDEDEPVLEPSWPHLQVVYEFLLRFVVSAEVSAKAAKRFIDQQFCLSLINLFESEDLRERDFLKTILHRIYGKVMHHRGFIRRAIGNAFHRYVYETERHAGISELLEILGSIINGFAKPLKQEHVVFLRKALLPLHKPKAIKQYHQHLNYCIVQYVEKDPETVVPVIQSLYRWWPWTSCSKQLLFLSELEEVLEVCSGGSGGTQGVLSEVMVPLVTLLSKCVGSTHFQVAERSLFYWNNEQLVGMGGALSMSNAEILLPALLSPTREHADGHWNAVVEGLAQNLLKMFMEHDPELFDKCSMELIRSQEERTRQREQAEKQWAALEELVKSKSLSRTCM